MPSRSIPTFVFPVFASYKALKSSDPALLTPWLMYWVVLACALLCESWVGFILVWIPFYAWIRLGFLLYLILPQTQGAKILYQTHVHPFLEENERSIDDFISSAHERAKAAGLNYLKQAIELVKQHVLGLPPKEATPPPTPSSYSYAQSLFARFNLPSARPAPAASSGSTANDFYSLLASAVTAATSASVNAAANRSSTSQPMDLSNSGTLIPPTVFGADRMTFIAAQRERLSILLSALDKEASNLQEGQTPMRSLSEVSLDRSIDESEERPRSATSALSKSRSEADFEKIDAESGTEEVEMGRRQTAKRTQSSGWMPWSWGGAAKADEGPDTTMTGTDDQSNAKSTGIEI
ncbi:protein YOP1 [Coleophoma crateriformis]|uniref:Protein YOP1 n=1 Tax=Coleophoma crateriformis TaxID=565419 RepID=A0A3D8RCR8_9HELO|nr:protein YOP1 [Coleophoma crateriformis]